MPSMVPNDPNYAETMGSPFISFYDMLMLNMHYNCTDKCKAESSAECKNGGFPHPRNCNKCICPSGYGGRLCNERPPGCGKELEALPTAQTLEDTVGSRSSMEEPRDDFEKCHYWIKAPTGKKIEVKLLSFSLRGLEKHGCRYGGVEIKTQADQRLTGYRFCSDQAVNRVLVSSSNIVPIITYNSFYESTTEIQYRYLD
ncbi:unnamed protein product [Heligmosomoides polygyrus]|uniref:CUB domain-containing protein n=1 Tax=Heligmosomoides polygyrus TaxID=6339 RepID=A0A3P8CQC2_HELPZ|nr:unnamed protein product [Heligmosomoides polygyrus]